MKVQPVNATTTHSHTLTHNSRFVAVTDTVYYVDAVSVRRGKNIVQSASEKRFGGGRRRSAAVGITGYRLQCP